MRQQVSTKLRCSRSGKNKGKSSERPFAAQRGTCSQSALGTRSCKNLPGTHRARSSAGTAGHGSRGSGRDRTRAEVPRIGTGQDSTRVPRIRTGQDPGSADPQPEAAAPAGGAGRSRDGAPAEAAPGARPIFEAAGAGKGAERRCLRRGPASHSGQSPHQSIPLPVPGRTRRPGGAADRAEAQSRHLLPHRGHGEHRSARLQRRARPRLSEPAGAEPPLPAPGRGCRAGTARNDRQGWKEPLETAQGMALPSLPAAGIQERARVGLDWPSQCAAAFNGKKLPHIEVELAVF